MIIFEENDDRFYVKESTVNRAGKGLFAAKEIKKNSWLEITGVLVERGSVADDCTYYANAYKFAANVVRKGDKVDVGQFVIVPMGYAGIVNHSDNEKNQNVEIRYLGDEYTKKSLHSDKAVYWFLRDVKKDEEILGHYGQGWNKVLNWVQETHDKTHVEQKDWEKFLGFNLYNLGDLIR